MSLKEAPSYWVVCDDCGEREDSGDFTIWADHGAAYDAAVNADWLTIPNGPDVCWVCRKTWIVCSDCYEEGVKGDAAAAIMAGFVNDGDDDNDGDWYGPTCWPLVAAELAATSVSAGPSL